MAHQELRRPQQLSNREASAYLTHRIAGETGTTIASRDCPRIPHAASWNFLCGLVARRRVPILKAMRTLDRSRQLQQRAEHLLPGGVDSPVRAFRAVGGDPPFVVRAEGAYLWDADGNRYIDYFGSWGPMILGHAFPAVVEAIQQAAAHSASFGRSEERRVGKEGRSRWS